MSDLVNKFIQSLNSEQVEILKQFDSITIQYNEPNVLSPSFIPLTQTDKTDKVIDDLESRYKELRQNGILLKSGKQNLSNDEKELLSIYNKIYRYKIIKPNNKKRTSMFD